jgi:hypothetical protein
MLNPTTMYILAKARQRDLLKEAEASRLAILANAARSDQPGLFERIKDGAGTLLIDAGERLKERRPSPAGSALG